MTDNQDNFNREENISNSCSKALASTNRRRLSDLPLSPTLRRTNIDPNPIRILSPVSTLSDKEIPNYLLATFSFDQHKSDLSYNTHQSVSPTKQADNTMRRSTTPSSSSIQSKTSSSAPGNRRKQSQPFSPSVTKPTASSTARLRSHPYAKIDWDSEASIVAKFPHVPERGVLPVPKGLLASRTSFMEKAKATREWRALYPEDQLKLSRQWSSHGKKMKRKQDDNSVISPKKLEFQTDNHEEQVEPRAKQEESLTEEQQPNNGIMQQEAQVSVEETSITDQKIEAAAGEKSSSDDTTQLLERINNLNLSAMAENILSGNSDNEEELLVDDKDDQLQNLSLQNNIEIKEATIQVDTCQKETDVNVISISQNSIPQSALVNDDFHSELEPSEDSVSRSIQNNLTLTQQTSSQLSSELNEEVTTDNSNILSRKLVHYTEVTVEKESTITYDATIVQEDIKQLTAQDLSNEEHFENDEYPLNTETSEHFEDEIYNEHTSSEHFQDDILVSDDDDDDEKKNDLLNSIIEETDDNDVESVEHATNEITLEENVVMDEVEEISAKLELAIESQSQLQAEVGSGDNVIVIQMETKNEESIVEVASVNLNNSRQKIVEEMQEEPVQTETEQINETVVENEVTDGSDKVKEENFEEAQQSHVKPPEDVFVETLNATSTEMESKHDTENTTGSNNKGGISGMDDIVAGLNALSFVDKNESNDLSSIQVDKSGNVFESEEKDEKHVIHDVSSNKEILENNHDSENQENTLVEKEQTDNTEDFILESEVEKERTGNTEDFMLESEVTDERDNITSEKEMTNEKGDSNDENEEIKADNNENFTETSNSSNCKHEDALDLEEVDQKHFIAEAEEKVIDEVNNSMIGQVDEAGTYKFEKQESHENEEPAFKNEDDQDLEIVAEDIGIENQSTLSISSAEQVAVDEIIAVLSKDDSDVKDDEISALEATEKNEYSNLSAIPEDSERNRVLSADESMLSSVLSGDYI